MQDKIGLPLDDIHILGNVPQCALICVCVLCEIVSVFDWHFHDGGRLTLIALCQLLIMNWQSYWQLSRAFHPLTAQFTVYSGPKTAEWVTSVIPRLSEKAMTALFVVSDSNGWRPDLDNIAAKGGVLTDLADKDAIDR